MNTQLSHPVQDLDAIVGFSVLDTLDEYRKDCKRGICHHPECHRKAARRFACLEVEGDSPVTDEEVGFDIMATWQEQRKDCFLGFCHHPECHHLRRRWNGRS